MIINTQYIEAIDVQKMDDDMKHVDSDSNIIIYIHTTRTTFNLPWDADIYFIWEWWEVWVEELAKRLDLLK